MSDFNIDENMINKLKGMLDNGELSDVVSKIPPEMIQNFSSMMNSESNKNSTIDNNSSNSSSSNFSNGFDFSNIDMNTVMKIKSVMDKMNAKDDPRTNLLRSLKPYLRDERKDKVDQYANLMNVAQIATLFNNNSNDQSGKK